MLFHGHNNSLRRTGRLTLPFLNTIRHLLQDSKEAVHSNSYYASHLPLANNAQSCFPLLPSNALVLCFNSTLQTSHTPRHTREYVFQTISPPASVRGGGEHAR